MTPLLYRYAVARSDVLATSTGTKRSKTDRDRRIASQPFPVQPEEEPPHGGHRGDDHHPVIQPSAAGSVTFP